MDIYEAQEQQGNFRDYPNVRLQRVANTSSPEYEVYFPDWKIGFTSTLALNKFLDSREIEREYRKKRKIV